MRDKAQTESTRPKATRSRWRAAWGGALGDRSPPVEGRPRWARGRLAGTALQGRRGTHRRTRTGAHGRVRGAAGDHARPRRRYRAAGCGAGTPRRGQRGGEGCGQRRGGRCRPPIGRSTARLPAGAGGRARRGAPVAIGRNRGVRWRPPPRVPTGARGWARAAQPVVGGGGPRPTPWAPPWTMVGGMEALATQHRKLYPVRSIFRFLSPLYRRRAHLCRGARSLMYLGIRRFLKYRWSRREYVFASCTSYHNHGGADPADANRASDVTPQAVGCSWARYWGGRSI